MIESFPIKKVQCQFWHRYILCKERGGRKRKRNTVCVRTRVHTDSHIHYSQIQYCSQIYIRTESSATQLSSSNATA